MRVHVGAHARISSACNWTSGAKGVRPSWCSRRADENRVPERDGGVVSPYARGILTGAHTHAQVVAQRDAAPATPLRFAVGDRVEVFCPSLPDSQPKNRRGKAKAKSTWFRAVVTQLWYREDGMLETAPYQCRLEQNQVGSGRGDGDRLIFVPVDIDELVTRLGQPPRDRLLEAIKQHCSQQHLEYIVRRHGLDVRVFGDTLIRAAANSCSYGAFIWLVRAYAERTTLSTLGGMRSLSFSLRSICPFLICLQNAL